MAFNYIHISNSMQGPQWISMGIGRLSTNQVHPLVKTNSSLLKNDPVEIVDLPINSMVTFQFPNF